MKPTSKNFACIVSLLLVTTCCHAQLLGSSPDEDWGDNPIGVEALPLCFGPTYPVGHTALHQNFLSTGYNDQGGCYVFSAGAYVKKLGLGFLFNYNTGGNSFHSSQFTNQLQAHNEAQAEWDDISTASSGGTFAGLGIYKTWRWRHFIFDLKGEVAFPYTGDSISSTYTIKEPYNINATVTVNEYPRGTSTFFGEAGIGYGFDIKALNGISLVLMLNFRYMNYTLPFVGNIVYTDNSGINKTYQLNVNMPCVYVMPFLALGVRFPGYKKPEESSQ